MGVVVVVTRRSDELAIDGQDGSEDVMRKLGDSLLRAGLTVRRLPPRSLRVLPALGGVQRLAGQVGRWLVAAGADVVEDWQE